MKKIKLNSALLSGHRRFRPGCAIRLRSCDELRRLQDLPTKPGHKAVGVSDQLLDGDIKRAVDAQLAGKGLRRADNGGDLLLGYRTAMSQG